MLKPRALTITALLLALLIQSLTVTAQITPRVPSTERDTNELTSSILLHGHSLDYVRDLSDTFGGRLSGSPAYQKAAQWAADQFRNAGIKNVKLEPFTMQGWQRGQAQATMISPLSRPLQLQSFGWAVSTPPNGIRGEVVLLDTLDPDQVKAQAARLQGKIVMLDVTKLYAQGFLKAYPLLAASPDILKAVGATAILIPDHESNDVLNASSLSFTGEISQLPVARLGNEDGQLIARLLNKGPVQIEFNYQNITPGPIPVNNVIAEIPGREKPDEWILIGAHLDSWDFGTGAQDNGTGVAMVLEAARAIAALDHAPRRSIRFALWSGEEQGLLGSKAYVKAHEAELDKCVAVLNTDNGAGHPKGWKYQGREDLHTAMQPISDQLTALGGSELSSELTFDTDHGYFVLAGVPSLDLSVDMTHYMEIHHKISDTFDKIDPHNLATGSAIVALTAYLIADQPNRIAPRLNHAQIDEIIKTNPFYDLLKLVGDWQ